MKNITQKGTKFGAMLVVLLATSCLPDDFENNGLTDTDLDATFTITPSGTSANRFTLNANSTDYIMSKWDLGDGSPAYIGNHEEDIFLPDAGTYTVTHYSVGKGGSQESKSLELVVATPDLNAGNLVVGGKMNAGDDDSWEFVTYSAGVNVNLVNGKMVWTGGGWGHAGIYQEIQVEGGKKYKVDMLVSGSGATNTWFEVYVGQAPPVPGSDYSDGGKRLALNTWNGCATTPFSGKLSALSCDGTGGGVVTFEEGGTAYLFIRGGGENLGTTGISIDNVELRGTE